MSGVDFGTNDVGRSVQNCPLNKVKKGVHWIEIRLLGEDEKPVPWEEYRIKLPNGSQVQGFLDEAGRGRIEGIEEPGNCLVTFPALDEDAWSPLGV
jgi:hypothetical protein